VAPRSRRGQDRVSLPGRGSRHRGLAGDVDQIRRLKLAGSTRATVVITRVNDKPWGLVCTDPDVA